MGVKGIRACPLRSQVDPRLVRFSAGATAVIVAAALLILSASRPLALGLLASQVAIFAFTGLVSFQWSLWAQFFARVIWPRLAHTGSMVDSRPPRFAQLIGFVFTAIALISFLVGVEVVGYGLTAIVLFTLILNAATGICVGCWIYVRLGRR